MLANQCPILPFTNGAAAVTKGKVVKLSSGKTVVSAASTDTPFGVVTEDADADADVSVAPAGSGAIVYVEAGGSISTGDRLVPTSSGRAIQSATATHKAFAIALEDGATGELIKATLSPGFLTL